MGCIGKPFFQTMYKIQKNNFTKKLTIVRNLQTSTSDECSHISAKQLEIREKDFRTDGMISPEEHH
jgi:hypothetical protein